MNVVDIVRENSACDNFHNRDYAKGFYNALDKVQAELDKEVSCDWEKESAQLKAKHECEITELKSNHEKEMIKLDNILKSVERERDSYLLYKAKWEAVELIFGGK